MPERSAVHPICESLGHHNWSTEPNETWLPEDPNLDWPWTIRTCCECGCPAVLLQRHVPSDSLPTADFLREATVYVPEAAR